MARPHVAVYLSCLLPLASALSGTATLTAYSPGTGVGLKLGVTGCTYSASDPVSGSGCETNETAMFKIKDDSTAGTLMLDAYCNVFDSWTETPTSPTASAVTTTFFYAFTMTPGNGGSYWLGAGCILDKGTGSTDTWPGTDVWTALTYTKPQTYTALSLPTDGTKTLSGNSTDIYVPHLLWAAPYSLDDAFPSSGYRQAQWAYVSTSQQISLYFNEPVTHTTGKSVYVYGYRPGMTYSDATKPTGTDPVHTFTTSTTSLLGTKVTVGATWASNRLYKVLVEAGAFKDANGNAFAGVNGRGSKVSDCWALGTSPLDRDCVIAFAVPMTITSASAHLTQMPSAVAAPVDVTTRTSVTQETNVIFEFSEAVTPGTIIGTDGVVSVVFQPNAAASTSLQIANAGNCIGTNCWSLFGSKSYVLDPTAVLKDSGEDKNSTQVTVSFSDGVFDYVEGFSYSFLTNVTEYFGNAPAIYAYQFSNGATDYLASSGDYYADGAALASWAADEALVLYFDTKVTGVATKYITFYPEDYSTTAAGTKTDTTACFTKSNGATDLRPCQLEASNTAIVQVAGTGSKVTIAPGQLIPGQTYNVTVEAGAFQAKGAGNGATAEFATKFFVPLSVASCAVSDGSVHSRVHRSSSLKLEFDGPVYAESAPAAISLTAGASAYTQDVGNADEVFYRNNPAATDKYMMIMNPRADALVGLPANEAVSLSIPSGVLKNFNTATASTCATYTTLYEDVVKPKLLSISNTGATTPYGASGYDTTTEFALTFSEDIQAATSGTASLITDVSAAGGEYHFLLGSTGYNTAGASAAISGRTLTLTVTGSPLATGAWTLTVPYSSLTDTATDTGNPGNNEFEADAADWGSTVTVGTDAVSATITLSGDGATAPACTVYSPQINYAGTTENTEVAPKTVVSGKISRTLVLSFDEAVRIRDTSASISLYGQNRTTGATPKLLDVNLDGSGGDVTCASTASGVAGCLGSPKGTVDFYWLDGCSSKSGATGCYETESADVGGDKFLFLFLMDLEVIADFSNYYFFLDDSFSIVTAYDYPTTCLRTATDASFVVFHVDATARTDITTVFLANAGTPYLGGGTENIKLEFSEPVTFGATPASLATIEFRSSVAASGTSFVLGKGNTTNGVVLSASGKTAVVQVPYPAHGSVRFDYLTVTFGDGSFVDLNPDTALGHDYTNATTRSYNSTVANAQADINQTWSSSLITDNMAPEALMLLPEGAQAGRQVLTGINVTAKLYILMSENVTVKKSSGIKVKKCGDYVKTVGITGFASGFVLPLEGVTCASASGASLGSVTMLDQSVVEVSLADDMKEYNMYAVTIDAGAFEDKSGVASAAQVEHADWMFFTEGTWKTNTAPTVSRYTWNDVVDGASASGLLTVWFDQPVAYDAGTAIANGLADAGESNANSQYNATTLKCIGGFKCTVETSAKLKTDTTYLVSIPAATVTDREGETFTGLATAYTSSTAPPVAFKTKAKDTTGPNLLFCSDATGTSSSVSMKLGFSEPVVLYGGYTEHTDTGGSLSYWCLFNQTHTSQCEAKVGNVKMTLEQGGMVVSFTSSAALISSYTADRQWGLYVNPSQITDEAASANTVASFDQAATQTMCGSKLITTSLDNTAPTYASASSLPGGASQTVHDGDYVVLAFNEEVTGAATDAGTGKVATLSTCGVQSKLGASACDVPTELETVYASDLKFGSSKALWQFTATLEQGVIYQVSTPTDYFADLSGNNDTVAHSLTFQVALESWDYRSRAATDPFSVILVNGARAGSGATVPVNTASVSVAVDVYFAEKVKSGVQLKAYVNKTSGSGYLVTTVTTSGESSVSLSFSESAATPLAENTEYSLTIYKSDKAWSTDLFDDADEYYTYFGNYKSQTPYYQGVKEGGTHVVFTTGAEDVTSYLGTPAIDTSNDGPFFLGGASSGLNATMTVSASPMIEVKVTTNATLPTVGDLTLYRAARVSASSLGASECDLTYPTYATCCATSWSKDTSTQSKSVSYGASGSSASVFYSFDGGLEAYSCYRVSVSAGAYKNADSEGTVASASYATWFTTADVATEDDFTSPTLSATAVSSHGGSFSLVATTAFVTLTFSEAIVAGSGSASLTPAPTGTVSQSISGADLVVQITGTPLAAGTAYTLKVPAAGVKDASGNYLNSEAAFTFTTVFIDTDTPKVLHQVPESVDTASVDARMHLFMSESVQAVAGKTALFSNTKAIDMTQSSFADFQEATDQNGVVIAEGPRVAFASFFSLTAGSAAHVTVAAGGLADYKGNAALAATVTFTAESFGDFTSIDAATPYHGNEDVRVTGATAVSCGDTVYLVGGGRSKVCTWGPAAAWTCAESSGLGSRSHASVAVDQDCALWVVGGSGAATNFVKSTDATATAFTALTPDPLPVQESEGVFAEGTGMPDSLPGASVAIVKGWQAVICGGGEDRCLICVDEACSLVGRSAAVPDAVADRYYGTMLVVERDLGSVVYFFGGQNAAMAPTKEAGAKCYQSVFMWDFQFDAWAGVSARISTTEARCGGAYAQAGDGLIVVVGGTNTTAQTNPSEYGIGAVDTMLQSAHPLKDSPATSTNTYASSYARPVVFAHGPSSAGIPVSPSSLVTLAFSEPIQGGDAAVCVTITSSTDTTAPLLCSAGALTCRTGACGTTGTLVSTQTPVKIVGESMVTIDIGSLAAAGATVTVDTKAGTDGFVKDSDGNAFVKETGATFSFSYAAAAPAFAGTIKFPTDASVGVPLDTNLVYEFNEALNADSVAAAFSLTVTPSIATDAANLPTIAFHENHTEHFAFVGGALKVAMGDVATLVPGMAYTSKLAAGSLVSGAASSAQLTASFTALNGPASAGIDFKMAADPVDDTALEPNDTDGEPTILSILPVDGMTGVHADTVDVEFSFSEAVTFADVLNVTAGADIPEVFELKFHNVTSGRWDTWKSLVSAAGEGQDVFVNTTAKTITVRLTAGKHDLKPNVEYSVGAFQSGVITDYRSESLRATDATKVWNKLSTSFSTYSFTTVGTAVDTTKPAVAAYAVSPLHDGKIILDDGADTVVHAVFNKPLAGAVVAEGTVLHTYGGGLADTTKTTGEMGSAEVLTVTIADFPSSVTSWNLYLPNAETGGNFVNMTAVMPSRPTLESSSPSGTDYDRFSSVSTVVLQFSEVVQAGEGTVTLAAVGDASDASNTLTYEVSSNSTAPIWFTGVYMILEPAEMMPGEVYEVSMTNNTIRGATGRNGIAEATYTPSTHRFATVPQIRFDASAKSIATVGAGVTFGPDSELLVIGGDTDAAGTDTNKTMSSTTHRDMDALAGDGKRSVCTRPCDAGATSTVERKIYKAPSTGGLRQMNVDGVYVSTTPEGAKALSPLAAPVACECPTCMFAPPERGESSSRTSGPPDDSVPVHGHFATSGAYDYTTQIAASNEEVALVCNVGPDMDATLKPTQGYEPAEHFRCTIASMEGDHAATAEYFGVWSIDEAACAPKPCLTYPESLGPIDGPLPTGYSSTDCATVVDGLGNYSLASGANCTVTCSAGYTPTGGAGDEDRLFECDRGIYGASVTCEKRLCTSTADGVGVKAGFAGTTVPFGDTLEVECEPGYEPDVASAACEADSSADESGVALVPADTLSCKPMLCGSPNIPDSTDTCGSTVFMESCEVTCALGMMPSTGSGTITCDVAGDGAPGYPEFSCIPVTCDTEATASTVTNSAGTAGTCAELAEGETCSIPCADGYAGNFDGTSVLVECTAVTNAGSAVATGTCDAVVCTDPKVSSCADSSDACGPTGGPYTYACGAGSVVAGTSSATTDVECHSSGDFKVVLESGDFADVVCVPSGSTATAVEKTVVSTAFQVSAADKAKMCGDMEGLATSMQTTLCAKDALSGDKCPDVTASPSVEGDCDARRARRLSDTVLFSVDFAVETGAMSEADAADLTSVLTELSTDPTFAAALQAEIESTVGVTVEGMEVSAPKTVVEYEVQQDPASKDGESEEGGGAILIIVGLLLVVGLGFGAWKMKQGSS